MSAVRRSLGAVAVCSAASTAAVGADADAHSGRRAPPADKPSWEFAITAFPTRVRGGENYTSAIAVADRGPLHLEARYNYESIGARSAFIGWTFSGGDAITWRVTPLIGGAWGTTQAVVPGLGASIGWQRFDFYLQSEYVLDRRGRSERYLYSWSELGFRPLEPLRVGLTVQRTRAYGGERELLLGPFVQLTWHRITVGAYWFNPGSADQVLVASIGTTF
jgi:hypothetical protein